MHFGIFDTVLRERAAKWTQIGRLLVAFHYMREIGSTEINYVTSWARTRW